MYGTPGPGYQGHNETENNSRHSNSDLPPSLKRGHQPRTAKMVWPEYVCFNPPLFYKGKCEECWCREDAKCERNGFRWGDRVAEMRERERVKVEAAKGKEKGDKNG